MPEVEEKQIFVNFLNVDHTAHFPKAPFFAATPFLTKTEKQGALLVRLFSQYLTTTIWTASILRTVVHKL